MSVPQVNNGLPIEFPMIIDYDVAYLLPERFVPVAAACDLLHDTFQRCEPHVALFHYERVFRDLLPQPGRHLVRHAVLTQVLGGTRCDQVGLRICDEGFYLLL